MAGKSLEAVVAQALGIDIARVDDALAYNTIPEWDSVAHMLLVSALESEFDVMLDTDEILDMSSIGKAREILARHGAPVGA